MQLCGYEVGNRRPFFLIAGPCVIESEAMALDIAHQMKEITAELGIPYIFKASYDKANRTSGKSFRGLGMEKGLEILAKVRAEVGVCICPQNARACGSNISSSCDHIHFRSLSASIIRIKAISKMDWQCR